MADTFSPPSRIAMLWRGITHRCAVCGCSRLFRGYFTMKERCPRCGLRFQRHEGQWSGDIGINTIVTFSLLWVVLVGGTLVMWGRLNVVLIAAVATVITVAFPIFFVPFAKTTWVAVDLMMRPLEPGELGEPAGPEPDVAHPGTKHAAGPIAPT